MKKFPVLAGALAFALSAPTAALAHHKTPLPRWWVQAALCVHSQEGSWQANTGNGFYGGMQMDMTFQRRHGAWALAHYGTADRWPVRVQLRVAYRGWRAQGWGAWPNTSRRCGLL